MTITVSLNALGLLKATDVVTTARSEAARRHDSEPRNISVDVGARTAPTLSARPEGQGRTVDLIV